ncbi:hypothetical protein HanPI659440_Chr01g0033331 [Helianthus annuus]|nr:hypothetical protein HanPI659440_Chr01g0033331 [Helianthus annuus]
MSLSYKHSGNPNTFNHAIRSLGINWPSHFSKLSKHTFHTSLTPTKLSMLNSVSNTNITHRPPIYLIPTLLSPVKSNHTRRLDSFLRSETLPTAPQPIHDFPPLNSELTTNSKGFLGFIGSTLSNLSLKLLPSSRPFPTFWTSIKGSNSISLFPTSEGTLSVLTGVQRLSPFQFILSPSTNRAKTMKSLYDPIQTSFISFSRPNGSLTFAKETKPKRLPSLSNFLAM